MLIAFLIAGLLLWMLGCGYAGFNKRFGLFLIILVVGMSLNTAWMVFGLDARPFSPPAMTAHLAAFMYAVFAVGIGFLVGRLVRGFRESRVDDS